MTGRILKLKALKGANSSAQVAGLCDNLNWRNDIIKLFLSMKIFTLGEGSYSVDGTKKFIPFNPEIDNPKDRPASLFINVNPFLVKTDTDLLLLDAGLGFKADDGELWLPKHIRSAGF